ncbi:inner-membrane translocator [Xylanimonas cellulosilytica DSM 15894]|uniref:Inner-membrane translocator n=1 Tax=Xylanimonas cellulosilytica (strain DSM 15894 / JCM 12276 / CECT 5975 / KCTC 9989 / LMG 20990 / NBRC 107835 / XIL07) TaxID=446471 RepID=D1BTY5_XYLCX|nr:branched-chain amino acid ABC transporter permease [Xylanimonas cellulosilytica]ACZ29149.1 inner-membrane translocator [Xylanimonas cellulosilytica DSM 15894]
MTTDRPTSREARARRTPWRRLLAAFAVAAAPVLLPVSPATAAADTGCTPDGVACVAVQVLDAENTRIGDVAATISGGDFSVDVVTSPDGPVSAELPGAGTYTVALDPATLPADKQLPAGAPTAVDVTGQIGSTAHAAFRVGAGATAPAETASPSDTPDDADDATGGAAGDQAGSDAATGTTDGGATVADTPEGDASQRELTLGQVWQQVGSGLRFGLLLALASIGLNLVFGTTGLSNFAHGEQVTLGAMFGYLSINVWGLPVWLAIPVTLVIAGATGWVQDTALWQPLRRRGTPVMQAMIVTIGLSIALQFTIQMVIGGRSLRVLSGNPTPLRIAGITLSQASWVSMAVATVCIVVIALWLTRTRIGQATRAVSDNPALAAATGIDPNRIIRVVWIMSTTLAALSGILVAVSFGAFNWSLGMQLLLLMFAAVTLGGLGTAFGALVGSILIGLVVELSNLVLPSDLRYASALVILILVLLVRPQGILGRRERIG